MDININEVTEIRVVNSELEATAMIRSGWHLLAVGTTEKHYTSPASETNFDLDKECTFNYSLGFVGSADNGEALEITVAGATKEDVDDWSK